MTGHCIIGLCLMKIDKLASAGQLCLMSIVYTVLFKPVCL